MILCEIEFDHICHYSNHFKYTLNELEKINCDNEKKNIIEHIVSILLAKHITEKVCLFILVDYL